MITLEFRNMKRYAYPNWERGDGATQPSLEAAKAEVLNRLRIVSDNEYRIREEVPVTYQVVVAKDDGGYGDSTRKLDASSKAAFEYIRSTLRDHPIFELGDRYAVQERPGKVIYHYYQPAQWRTE